MNYFKKTENMKKNGIGTLAACLALLTTSMTFGQTPDTTRTMERTDKTYIEEHTTVYDTVRNDPGTQLQQDYTYTATPSYTTPYTATNEEPGLKEPPALKRGEFGLRYMPLFTSLGVYTSNGNSAGGHVTMTHGAGAMIGFNFNKNVGLQLEGNYYNASGTINDQATGQTYNVDMGYLNFPLLLVLNTDKRRAINLNGHVGPQFGLNVSSNVRTSGNAENQTVSATISTGNNDVGLAYGAGLEIALNKAHTLRLDLGYRGFYGLVDLGANETNHGNNTSTYNIFVRGSRQANGAYLGLRIGF
jgi:hypothetical protein